MMERQLCPKCGADLDAWESAGAFGEPHSCVTGREYIVKVLRQLFRKDELTTPELESMIKGRG